MNGSKAPLALLLAALSAPSNLGCGYVRDARLCVKTAEAIRGVGARSEKLVPEPVALAREAARWETLRREVEALAARSPKNLAHPLRSLAKEAGLVRDTLGRARDAVEKENLASYQSQSRSLDATRRRLDNVTREVKRVCGAQ